MIIDSTIGVVIPALNEQDSIGRVIDDIPTFVDWIVVVDNGSSDDTAQKAESKGAIVLVENRRGYGFACQKGIDYLSGKNTDIIVFLDGDYSDHPDEMNRLVGPILEEDVDFVVGSRTRGHRERGALLPQARLGNKLAGILIKLFWGSAFTDLGPFRAIKRDILQKMNMIEFTYGWTVEMQIKAAKMKVKTREVPVSYRCRIGQSKVTGTLSGTIKASIGILSTIFRHLFSSR